MKVICLKQDQLESWDAFVAGSEEGTLFHQSKWRNVVEGAFPHIRGHFLALVDSDSNSIIAGMPLFEVRSSILGDRLIGSPYSNWCDPIVSDDEQLDLLLAEARKLGDSLCVKHVEIKCRATRRENLPEGWRVDDAWKLHTAPLNLPEKDIWSGLSRTAVRLLVRKAEKSGIEVSIESDAKAITEFYDAFLETRQNLGLPAIPYRYFECLSGSLNDEAGVLFVARKSGETLGAVWLLIGPGEAHLEFAASRPEEKKSGAMQLLYWRAIQFAKTKSCKEFSFGRTAKDNQGLLTYKRRWNTTEEDLFSLISDGNKATNPSRLKGIGKELFRRVQQVLPRPIYRRLGRFLYGHWG